MDSVLRYRKRVRVTYSATIDIFFGLVTPKRHHGQVRAPCLDGRLGEYVVVGGRGVAVAVSIFQIVGVRSCKIALRRTEIPSQGAGES